MNKFSDQKIIESWQKNIQPWVTAIHQGEIETRIQITNQAIIDAIVKKQPLSVLDIGCGEGWLVREMEKLGIKTLGIDIIPEFIHYAQAQNQGNKNTRFRCLSYEAVSIETLNEQFDCIICNFSLLGNESVTHIFQQAPALLNQNGCLIIQTIHPIVACGEAKDEDGWREGSWQGFNKQFSDPAPWYFRTLESWKKLFMENGFEALQVLEPINPKTTLAQDIKPQPASVILIGETARI